MTVRATLVLLVLAASPAFAQPSERRPTDDVSAFEADLAAMFVAGGLTADQVAARSVKVSPAVRRHIAEVDASIATAQAAEIARVPQVSAKLAYTRLAPIDPVMFGPMSPPIEFPENAYTAQAQVNVALSDYVLRYPKLIEAARLGLDVARTSKRSSEVNAGQEARLAYYEWIRARLQVLIAERQLVQVQAVVRQVRALAEAQRVSKAELLRVESEEAQAEHVVDQLRNLAELRETQLRLHIGATPQEPLAIGEDVRADLAPPAVAGVDELVQRATQQRLEFRVLDVGIRGKIKQRESERASRLPRLSAFAVADYVNPNQRQFPPEDKFVLSWSAGLQLTWALNETLLGQTTLDRLAAETDQLRADREALLRGTRIEVLAAQQAVRLAQQALATSKKGLVAAQEGYRVRRALLEAERATAVELVDAETTLTRARIAALNARVDLRVALAQLAHAIGDDVR